MNIDNLTDYDLWLEEIKAKDDLEEMLEELFNEEKCGNQS